jgi:hypothetical protein
MATHALPKDLGDLLLIEVAPGWTKDTVTLRAGTDYALGIVLARLDGKYQPVSPAAEDDSAIACAVTAERVDAKSGDQPGTVIARGAVLDASELIWPQAITPEQKDLALAQLNSLGIVARAAL